MSQFGQEFLKKPAHTAFVNDTTKEKHGMPPWLQRLVIGVMVAVMGGGIAAWSNIVIKNNQTASRIEAKVEDIAIDFDRFVDLRYQADMDRINARIAQQDVRLDKLSDGE
jgi:hypothetical protein